MESKVLRTTITTLLESLDRTFKPFRVKHLLREELKEKSVLLRSIIISSNNQRNKCSDKTPENPTPYLPIERK